MKFPVIKLRSFINMTTKHPFYIKSTVILLCLVLLVYALSHLGDILIPLAFAAMIAILINPLYNWLVKIKIPKVAAIFISLLLAMTVFGCISYFISSQLASFSTDLPLFKKKFSELFVHLQQDIDGSLGIDIQKQNEWLARAQSKLEPLAGSLLSGIFGMLSLVFLIPVYTFLILFYKTLLVNFLYEVFSGENTKEVAVVLTQTKQAIQSYMFGLLVEALIVAILNTSALLLLGIKYALLIGVIGALLNILPYIGGIIAISIPILIATITKDGYYYQLWIIAAYLIIQFIDNNFLIPYVVSSKVKINALVSIVIVLMGGALWGISGMFLSIPFTGLLKIIFDRIPGLKPWGKLLGDHVPTRAPRRINAKSNRIKEAAK